MKLGQKVKLKPSYAKWYLNNPDIYEIPGSGKLDDNYESDTLLHLTCCLGEPVYGIVLEEGYENCYRVKWKVGNFKAEYYVTRYHVEQVK